MTLIKADGRNEKAKLKKTGSIQTFFFTFFVAFFLGTFDHDYLICNGFDLLQFLYANLLDDRFPDLVRHPGRSTLRFLYLLSLPGKDMLLFWFLVLLVRYPYDPDWQPLEPPAWVLFL